MLRQPSARQPPHGVRVAGGARWLTCCALQSVVAEKEKASKKYFEDLFKKSGEYAAAPTAAAVPARCGGARLVGFLCFTATRSAVEPESKKHFSPIESLFQKVLSFPLCRGRPTERALGVQHMRRTLAEFTQYNATLQERRDRAVQHIRDVCVCALLLVVRSSLPLPPGTWTRWPERRARLMRSTMVRLLALWLLCLDKCVAGAAPRSALEAVLGPLGKALLRRLMLTTRAERDMSAEIAVVRESFDKSVSSLLQSFDAHMTRAGTCAFATAFLHFG